MNNHQYMVRLSSKAGTGNLSVVLKQLDGRLYRGEVYPYLDNQVCIYHQIFVMRLSPG